MKIRKRLKVMNKALHMELREHKSSFVVYVVLRMLVILMMILQIFNRNYGKRVPMHSYIDIANHAKPGTDQLEDRTSHCSGDNDTDLHICGGDTGRNPVVLY